MKTETKTVWQIQKRTHTTGWEDQAPLFKDFTAVKLVLAGEAAKALCKGGGEEFRLVETRKRVIINPKTP